jgi:hypothetical protein
MVGIMAIGHHWTRIILTVLTVLTVLTGQAFERSSAGASALSGSLWCTLFRFGKGPKGWENIMDMHGPNATASNIQVSHGITAKRLATDNRQFGDGRGREGRICHCDQPHLATVMLSWYSQGSLCIQKLLLPPSMAKWTRIVSGHLLQELRNANGSK